MKVFLLLAGLVVPAVGFAGLFSIDWSKITGGGGTSTNSQLTVSGTIGQPDASAVTTGGNYSVIGGFWSLVSVVQTPGAPLLTITRSGANVIVSWPSPSTGFSLQQNTNLSTTNWTNLANPVNTVGSENQVVISPLVDNQFFRLR